jgi:hypothetical protein
MRISAKRAIALPVAALSAVALTGIAANSASATTVTSGSVTLNVNVTFLQALAKYGVALVPSGYSAVSTTSSQVSVTFALTGGDADVSTYSGTATVSGGICAYDAKTKKSTQISALLFDLLDAQFDGQTATSGGEEPLVDLAGTQSGNINGTTETYVASDLTLDAAGAADLNAALGTSAFVGGEDVGSFGATWVI